MNTILHTILLLFAMFASPLVASANDWMARLSDDTRVCRVSIPGTHDAATGEGFIPEDTLLGNRIAITQELPLTKQWQAGIRAFDLRPDVRTDSLGKQSLHVYHGEFATRASFAYVLQLLRDSLRAHPTEFAVIIMRHESSPNRQSLRWGDMMDYALALNRDILVDFRPDITVGQMRGRVLLLSRDEYGTMPRGGYLSGWRHDADVDFTRPATIRGNYSEGRLVLQDFYDMSGEDGMPTKLGAIERLQRLVTNREVLGADANTWFVNHTSGYLLTTNNYGPEPVSTSEGYRANAAETNRWLVNLIESRESRVRHHLSKIGSGRPHRVSTGIVMMDFGGCDNSGTYNVYGKRLVDTIINSNFQ